MFKQTIFLLSLAFAGGLKLQPGEKYNIEWNNNISNQVNLELDININNSWVTHTKKNTNFLSVILDGNVGNYNWDIPFELSKYWNHDSRLQLINLKTNEKISNIEFNFYGLTINPIEDLTFNDTLFINWNTNIDSNFTLTLLGDTSPHLINTNAKNNYEWELPSVPEGTYQIQVSYPKGEFDSNKFQILEKLEEEKGDEEDLDSPINNCFNKNDCKIAFFIVLGIIGFCVLLLCCYCCCK